MKRVLLGFVALALLVATECRATAAPVVFDANCMFESSLYGTVTIDTATGKALSADLVLKVPGIVFDKNVSTSVVKGYVTTSKGRQVVHYVEIAVEGYDKYLKKTAWLYLVIPYPSLVGYEGGQLVPWDGSRSWPFSVLTIGYNVAFEYLYMGTLAPQ
jgi:hypothetical protein